MRPSRYRTHTNPDGWASRLLVACLAAAAGCSSTSAPSGDPDLYRGRYEPHGQRFTLQHATTAVRSAGLELVPSVAWTDSALRVHVRVALRNTGSVARYGPHGVQVEGFRPVGVWPLNAGCVPPIPGDLPPQCLFWYDDATGTDHTLDPGESSLAIEWIFDGPTGGGFTFDARLWWPHG